MGVVENVVMRQSRPFGEAGRAGGVLDVDRVVELQCRFAAIEVRIGDRLAAVKKSVPIVVQDPRLAKLRAIRTVLPPKAADTKSCESLALGTGR